MDSKENEVAMAKDEELKDLLYKEHVINKELLDLKMEMQVLGVQLRELGDRLYNSPTEILFAGEEPPAQTVSRTPPLDMTGFLAAIQKLPRTVARYKDLSTQQKSLSQQRRVMGF